MAFDQAHAKGVLAGPCHPHTAAIVAFKQGEDGVDGRRDGGVPHPDGRDGHETTPDMRLARRVTSPHAYRYLLRSYVVYDVDSTCMRGHSTYLSITRKSVAPDMHSFGGCPHAPRRMTADLLQGRHEGESGGIVIHYDRAPAAGRLEGPCHPHTAGNVAFKQESVPTLVRHHPHKAHLESADGVSRPRVPHRRVAVD